MKVERAGELGFCFGVRRAIGMVEKLARERGGIETLGALVHNRQVLDELGRLGVRVASSPGDIHGDTIVLSAPGVSPPVEEEIRSRHIGIVDTTCPFVRRAQRAAGKLAKAGFFVIIYGDAGHPEVKSVLGWAENKGMAALDAGFLATVKLPGRTGILSQTTAIPTEFTRFAKNIIDGSFGKGSEIRVIDTICHDIRTRQQAALELARRASLMLVIGDRRSANTNRLVELCSAVTRTVLVETPADVPATLASGSIIGVTAGTSTSEQTISEVISKLE